MSFKNKYNKYQSYQLRYQGAVNLYHRLTPNKNKKYPLTGINIGTGAKLEIIPCSELKTKKPKSIPKMRAKFQRANLIKYHRERLCTLHFLWSIDEFGLQPTIEDTPPLGFNKLPTEVKAQVTYLRTELNTLRKMLEKAVPEYNENPLELIKAEKQVLNELLKSKP